VRDWAQQWHALGSIVLDSDLYRQKLQLITDQFTLSNADPSKPPNKSALNQLRTNEFAIALSDDESNWELREFKICGDATACSLGQLEGVTIAQTPDDSFQFQPPLGKFVNDNEIAILAGKHTVPLQLPPPNPIPFRGGAVQPGAGFVWDSSAITNPDARHAFALATCNGCHTVETATHFVHISKRAAGSRAMLSAFLTNDLLNRQMKLDAAANMSCLRPRVFPIEDLFPQILPPGFPH